MEDLALQFVSGLLKAMFLFLLASGLSLIFGVSRVLNITHGAFYALGAYLLLTVSRLYPLAWRHSRRPSSASDFCWVCWERCTSG